MRIYRWENLPDARDPNAPDGDRCCVVLLQQHLAHMVERHLGRQDGPWTEWLGPKLCEQLIQWLNGELELGPAISDELCERFQEQVGEALRRPLVVLQPMDQRNAAWILVLPCGALAIVRPNREYIFVVPAYSLYRARIGPPHKRWLRAVHSLVWRYCDLEHIGGALQLVLGNGCWVRWVRLETWGFATAGESLVWRGRLAPWPAAEKLSPPKQDNLLNSGGASGHT